MFKNLWFIAPKTLIILLSNLSIVSIHDEGYYVHDEGYYVHDEGYSGNASCALDLISTFLLNIIPHLAFIYVLRYSFDLI